MRDQGGAQREFITSDSVSIAYGDFGPRADTALVFCHGICASGRQFAADAAYFAARGFRVLVPDLRAHGRSGAPGPGGDFSIARLATDMTAMLDDAGIAQVHWLGNSLGGIVGLALLAENPGRFASFASFGTAFRLDLPKLAPPVLPLLYKTLGDALLGRLTAALTTPDKAAQRLIAEMVAAVDPAAMQQIADAVRHYDFIAAAQRYDGPMLLIRAERDRLVNLGLGSTFAAMRQRPRFRRVDLKAAGHCANLDQPERLREILLEFWRPALRLDRFSDAGR